MVGVYLTLCDMQPICSRCFTFVLVLQRAYGRGVPCLVLYATNMFTVFTFVLVLERAYGKYSIACYIQNIVFVFPAEWLKELSLF